MMVVASLDCNVHVSGNYEQLGDYCGKMSDVLVKNAAHLEDVLATLNVQEHSIGYLTVL